jgi:hypothetical protein
VASRARAVLFIGVALLAGGFAGSLVRNLTWPLSMNLNLKLITIAIAIVGDVQTVLILKYLVPGYDQYAYYGGANVGMNGGLMLR